MTVEKLSTAQRTVVRNRRFQLIGTLFVLFAAGMVAVAVIVITSPSQSIDNPDGFTGGGRALTAIACAVTAAALGVFGIGALRVAMIIDETRLVIRNPMRTTKVAWTSGPKFEIRNRVQVVNVSNITSDGASSVAGNITYRYHEIVCVADRQHIWIAATSRMRAGGDVDHVLAELRRRGSRRKHKSSPSSAPSTPDTSAE